jgi:hypothetical protein
LYQIRPQGIAFDITADHQQMLVTLDRKTLEAALVERARARGMVVRVPALRMRHRQQPHEFTERAAPPRD